MKSYQKCSHESKAKGQSFPSYPYLIIGDGSVDRPANDEPFPTEAVNDEWNQLAGGRRIPLICTFRGREGPDPDQTGNGHGADKMGQK